MSWLAPLFRVTSFLRGARTFHPRGFTATATWEPGAVLGSPLERRRAAVVRISHGIGLRPAAPDILGLAVKVPDAHGDGRDQDLLLASTGAGRLGRHLLVVRRDLAGTAFSTLLPYDVAGLGHHPIVARAVAGTPATTYADLHLRGPVAVPAFEFRVASFDGPLLATLRPDPTARVREGDALSFDPWHTGPELVPVGRLNRLRRPTYGASRRGRTARRRAERRHGGTPSREPRWPSRQRRSAPRRRGA